MEQTKTSSPSITTKNTNSSITTTSQLETHAPIDHEIVHFIDQVSSPAVIPNIATTYQINSITQILNGQDTTIRKECIYIPLQIDQQQFSRNLILQLKPVLFTPHWLKTSSQYLSEPITRFRITYDAYKQSCNIASHHLWP